MNKRKLIDIVRQYAAATRRKGVSYAEPVKMAVDLHIKWAAESGMSFEEIAKQEQWSRSLVEREYAKFDKSFAWEAVG